MSHKGLKSRRPRLLLDEEKGKCGAVKYCAAFPSIGNHSPKRKRTKGGLSDWRHSQSQWKLEQNIIAGVVIVRMVAKILPSVGFSNLPLLRSVSCECSFM